VRRTIGIAQSLPRQPGPAKVLAIRLVLAVQHPSGPFSFATVFRHS